MAESSFEKSIDITKEMILNELKSYADPELIKLFDEIYEWQKVGGQKLIEKEIENIINEILEGGAENI